MLRGPLRPLLRNPLRPALGVGPISLVQQAIGILRKYGTDAHVYIPGTGTLNGITAGNFLDSIGTTAASVDNPVGLSLDALQGAVLGAELCPTFATPANWGADAGWVVSGGVATATSAGINANVIPAAYETTVVGSTYAVTAVVPSLSSGSARLYLFDGAGNNAASVLITAPGTYQMFCVATTTTSKPYINSAGSLTAVVSSISCKQVPGIHASQPTTAMQPILRQSGGKYSWQFDGSNDGLYLNSQPFQSTDDHCLGVAFKITSASDWQGIFENRNTADGTTLFPAIEYALGHIHSQYRDNAGDYSEMAFPYTTGTKCVVSTAKKSTAYSLCKDGAQVGSFSLSKGTTTINSSSFGCSPFGHQLGGDIYAAYSIKGSVSAAERLVLDRFLGLFSGVSF